MDINLLLSEGKLGQRVVPKENHTPASGAKELRAEAGAEREDASLPLPPAEEMAALGIRPLWKGKDASTKSPAYENQKELPHHRIVAYLKATGMKNVEIARRLGYSPVTINYLVRQPFMELLVLEEIKKTCDPALQLILNESYDAASRVIEISKTAESEEVRRKANESILDRKWGKASQPMSIVSGKDMSALPDAELEKIIAEGLALQQRTN